MEEKSNSEFFTPEQYRLVLKYRYDLYITNLKRGHYNTREEIFELEKATRGQSSNNLWRLLRINRTTASQSTCSAFNFETEAIMYGNRNENVVKQNELLMRHIGEEIEHCLGKSIKEYVANCGMFISKMGIHSASPDAYYMLDDDNIVVVEIKCPYTYREKTLTSIRNSFNTNKSRYRITNTAFSINRSGPPFVKVEEKNTHYRQMQAQMYVTGAVMAVYIVLIGQTPEVHFVERNASVIQELEAKEKKDYTNYIINNERCRMYVMEKNRRESFKDCELSKAAILKLSRSGFYYHFGKIICYFCRVQVELERGVDNALLQHAPDCNKEGDLRHAIFKYPRYFSDKIREQSLDRHVSDKQTAAKNNLFCDGSKIALYCCGNVIKSDLAESPFDIKDLLDNIVHTIDCERF
ncbi:alkaline exonuclease [Spodoptera litura granulovirus]|uniref:Alkaline exonuclease n=1 Tax=Spodoptera litura granulovirus TaxID=359919 RepID=A5IZW9_9BBAC|nr:alkaline exonuclease [Spodoptera litura granulovirus]ABQ52060.1 alkaline exonuclease [Spodoptera litura granulovirus]